MYEEEEDVKADKINSFTLYRLDGIKIEAYKPCQGLYRSDDRIC